ncbi:MAG: NHL repeat-containing protein, partial [Desulfobacteria bacterium]
GSGTPGDDNAAGGILAVEAHLGNPTAVKAGPDDSIYVSSSAYKKVKRIDRYGYLSDVAGDGTHGTLTPGAPAASSPVGAVQDIDTDPAGNLYLFNDWNQIVRVDNGVVNKLVYDNGVENSVARFNLAVVNVDLLYFVNYLENRVYRMSGTSKSDYVTDNLPYSTTEPINRFNYPLRAPSSIAYASMSDSLVFADTDNDRIMRLSFSDLNIYYLVADAGGTRFSEGIDPLAMAPSRPRVVDYNPITGKIFFVEGLSDQVLYIDAAGKVRLFSGTGSPGFSGDGGPSNLAQLNDPRAIAVDSRGNAYIADNGNHAIRMVVGGALP